MKRTGIFVFWTLSASTFLLAAAGPDMDGRQTTGSTTQTEVQSVNPQAISLTPGGRAATATMTGTGLGNILDVQVIQAGKPAEGFEITLKPRSGTTRAFDIKAANKVALGEYQLRIILRAQKRDLPAGMASVVVKAGAPSMRIAQKARATAAAPPTQASSQSAKVVPSALPPKDTRVIRSSAFNSIAMGVFEGAYFDAMSCGGRDSERKTTVNVPNAYFKQEPLDRMEYKFTDGEEERSLQRRGDDRWYRLEIRACVDGWRLAPGSASIEGGRFKIPFSFTGIKAINTRAIDEERRRVNESWDWSAQKADSAIQDFRFSGGLNIFLTPVIENGELSFRLDDARWEFYGPLTGWIGPGHFALPEVEEPKIIHYKDRMLEVIRQRIVAIFGAQAVRAKLSAALNQSVKTGDFADRTIIGVSGKGEAIEVTFQK